MRRASITPAAAADLEDIWLYIAQNNPQNADRFIARLIDKCQILAEQPGIGSKREQLGTNLRGAHVGNYIIFYRPISTGVEIVRVLHGARDIEALFRTEDG